MLFLPEGIWKREFANFIKQTGCIREFANRIRLRMMETNAKSMLVNYLIEAPHASWLRNGNELDCTASSANNFPKTEA